MEEQARRSRNAALVAAGAIAAGWLAEKGGLRKVLMNALQGSRSQEALLVRKGPHVIAGLIVASFVLMKQSRSESKEDDDEKGYMERELLKRKDRLQGVLEFAREALKLEDSQDEVDVDVVIEATQNVANISKNDPMIAEGLRIAARGVARNIQNLGELSEAMGSDQAATIIRQLDFEQDIYTYAEYWAVDKHMIDNALAEVATKARRAIRVRKSNQIVKALLLFERARSQLPYLILSSLLSILEGSTYALKADYMSKVMSLAYDRLANGVHNGPSKVVGHSMSGTIRTLFVLELLELLSRFLCVKVRSMGSEKFVINLQTELFQSLISQDIVFFEQNDVYESRSLIGNANHVCMSLFNLPTDTIQNLSVVVSTALMLFRKSKNLSMLVLLLLPTRLLLSNFLETIQDRLEGRNDNPNSENMRNIWNVLVNPVGLRTLRMFGRETMETAIFSQGLKTKSRVKEESAFLYNSFDILYTVLDKLVDILSLWYGGVLASKGLVEVADLATFTSTASYAFEGARRVYYEFKTLLSNNGLLDSAEKIYDLLHKKPKIGIDYPPLSEMPRDPSSLRWSVEFKDVEFSYPTRPQVKVLHGVSFLVKEGERLGILGESGCGKSTLISLLTRLYDPDQGSLLIAGKPLPEFNPLWFRRNIAVVSQSMYLPYRTVKENLMYGLFHVDPTTSKADQHFNIAELEAEMRNALRIAHCEDLFFDKARFPQQWHTDIGSDGASLSGGERQRLCIARAILSKPRILILDEATAALDEESQFQVQEAIQSLYEASGRRLTILTIAHRLSNFRYVDKLVVLEKGKIVEEGSASELATLQNGVFANFLDKSQLDFSYSRPPTPTPERIEMKLTNKESK